MKYVPVVFVLILIVKMDYRCETSKKKAKFWPVGIVRFRNDVCTSLDGFDGTCYTRRQCQSISGAGAGRCANGVGVCCVYQRTCGGSSSYNNTYFVNPGFPNSINSAMFCSFTIHKCNSDICQVRLDFLNLNLAQPDGNGNCITDSFIVTGSGSIVAPICGINSGQHMYLMFNNNSDIKLMISTSGGNSDKSWNIKITQLACDCPSLAPSGCLMYYTANRGTVNSFNYGTNLNGALINTTNGVRPGTRQIANTNYGVCIRMTPGFCSIRWSQTSDPTSFTITDNTALAEVIPGLPSGGLLGENCTTDYVVIPNPSYANGSAVNSDRFCGNQLPTVQTSSKPFVLTVVTDGDDMPDIANRGFSLNYQQLPCQNTRTMGFFPG